MPGGQMIPALRYTSVFMEGLSEQMLPKAAIQM